VIEVRNSNRPNRAGVFNLSSEDGNRSSFRKVMLFRIQDEGQRPKKPVILTPLLGFSVELHSDRCAVTQSDSKLLLGFSWPMSFKSEQQNETACEI
jgi:hypothetical protein